MNNPKDAKQNPKIATEHLEPLPHLGTSISLAGHYQAAAGQHHVAHRHPGHELILWRSGHVECLLGSEGRQVIATNPGMVTLWPGQLLHADRARSAYSHMYLIFEHNLAIPGLGEPAVLFDDQTGSLERLLLSVVGEFNSEQAYRSEVLDVQLRQLALLLARLKRYPPDSAERLVQRMERLIEARYASNPTIEALAEELNSATSTLRLHFARLRSYSPKGYLQQVRLRHVLAYIRNSSMTLDEIASTTGYTSSGHLWQDVRRLTGRTPGSFRSPSDCLLGHSANEPSERT